MDRLEDYLLPENLLKKRDDLIQEIDGFQILETKLSESKYGTIDMEKMLTNEVGIDAVIDDGGISGQPLTIDEIMELESRNYPNIGYEFDDISKDEIEEERLLSELGFKDWVGGIEDEEHFVDHEEYHFDPDWFKENRLKGEGDTEAVTFEFEEIDPRFKGKTSSIEYYLKSEEDEIHLSKDREKNSSGELSIIPDYLLNDPEIVGYPDRVTQSQIYEWVNSKIKYPASIKDLGCGRADINGYLDWRNDDRPDYIGIESNPNLCEVGRKKYPSINIINADFNDVSIPTDFTICIGTLNDDHGFDKWEFFNKTLNHALNNTKTAIIFVLQADCYGNEGHLDYPLGRMVSELGSGLRFEIDNSFMEDIYCLTVHIGGFN